MTTMTNEEIKNRLKSYFQSGDVPTEGQFGELIDEAISADASRLTEGKLGAERLPKQIDLNNISGEGDATLVTKMLGAETVETDTLNTDALSTNTFNTNALTASQINSSTLNSDDVTANNVQASAADLTTLQSTSVTATDVATETLNADSFIADSISVTRLNAQNAMLDQSLSAKTLSASGTLSAEHADIKTVSADAVDVSGALTATSVTATLSGDGADITHLNPDAIAGKVKSDKLYKGTKSALGVMQFATQEEIDANADNRAVTPKSMNQSIQHSVSQSQTATQTQFQNELSQSETRTDGKIQAATVESKTYTDGKVQTATAQNKAYIDGEIALLQAGIKFKKGVATVISEPMDLASGEAFPEVDGYQIAQGDRVLFTHQDDAKQNRVYLAASNNTWELADDFDAKPEFELFVGLSLEVLKGNALRQSIWSVTELQNPDDPELTWQKRNDINNYEAGSGIRITGRTIGIADDWFNNEVTKDVAQTWLTQGLQSDAAQSWLTSSLESDAIQNWFTNNLEGGTVSASSIVGQLDVASLPLADIEAGMSFLAPNGEIKHEKLPAAEIESGLSFVDEAGKIKAEALPIEEIKTGISVFNAEGLVDVNKIQTATTEQLGTVELATAAEVDQGTDNTRAITPQALANADLLSQLFHFVPDTGQNISVSDVPEGKILALYENV